MTINICPAHYHNGAIEVGVLIMHKYVEVLVIMLLAILLLILLIKYLMGLALQIVSSKKPKITRNVAVPENKDGSQKN